MGKLISNGHLPVKRILCALSAAACLLPSLHAESNLIKSSPFLPPGWGEKVETPPLPPPQAAPLLQRHLEFKGVFDMGGTSYFSIFDRKEGKGYWLALNQLKDSFQVVRYNEEKNSVLVRSAGRTEELVMAKGDNQPMQISGRPVAAVTQPKPTVQTNPNNRQANTARRGPVVPRRRIIRRQENTANNNEAQQPANITTTPASPVQQPPSS
ncbi:MAG: hypothetical protein AAGF10_03340 [Verrucomicrobiota bacterium]